MESIRRGLCIISINYDNEDGFGFSTGHDQIWAGPDNILDNIETEKIRKRMEELNWFIDEEFDCWSHFC